AAWNQNDNPWLKARALWQLGALKEGEPVLAALESPDPNVRILAYRVFKEYFYRHPDQFAKQFRNDILKDTSPAVRREFLLLLRDLDPNHVNDIVLELARQYDGKDRF